MGHHPECVWLDSVVPSVDVRVSWAIHEQVSSRSALGQLFFLRFAIARLEKYVVRFSDKNISIPVECPLTLKRVRFGEIPYVLPVLITAKQ